MSIIEAEAKIRRDNQALNDTWRKIYECAAIGNGESGFNLFKAALDKAFSDGKQEGWNDRKELGDVR